MSILHRTAYLTLSTFLAIVPAACGGDDDDDDTPGTPDAGDGDEPDAAVDEPDAAVDEPDAAVVEGVQYLLGLDVTATAGELVLNGVVRIIATVDIGKGTADFSLQPVISPVCDEKTTGQPVGDPRVETGVTINKDGSFTLDLTDATLPAGSVGIMLACGMDINGDLTVEGQVEAAGPCGEISGMGGPPINPVITGTFGSVLIENGTIGEDLPPEVLTCAK